MTHSITTEDGEPEEFTCFHVTRVVPYNQNAPLSVGVALHLGATHNPFFAFYEQPRKYNVTLNDGSVVWSPAIRFLKAVRAGEVNCPQLPQIAVEVSEHYLMLVRELVTEEVRRLIAPNLPSRQTCLWATDDLDQARHWVGRLGGGARVVRLDVRGRRHRADAALLLGDSEPLSQTYARATQYWQGEKTAQPELELLISGAALGCGGD